jgi:NTP pyrophosphatase (non-canonical NTP hydrolase)
MNEELIELVDLTDEEIAAWNQEIIEDLDRRFYTFSEYQNAITDFAVYPEKNTGRPAALSYCGLGLGGETGEVLEHLKKIQRDNAGEVSPERREALSKEMGDVLWYLCRLASELSLDMSVVASDNVQKLQDRLDRNVIHGDGDNR